VSNELPFVSKTAVPDAPAVHFHQIDPVVRPQCEGSPLSRVAFTVVPLVEPLAPETVHAFRKLSLPGAPPVEPAGTDQFRATEPVEEYPATAM
jgi:hypothetical protein